MATRFNTAAKYYALITHKNWNWEGAQRCSASLEEIKTYGELREIEGAAEELKLAIYGIETNLMDVPHSKEERAYAKCESKNHRIRLKELEKRRNKIIKKIKL